MLVRDCIWKLPLINANIQVPLHHHLHVSSSGDFHQHCRYDFPRKVADSKLMPISVWAISSWCWHGHFAIILRFLPIFGNAPRAPLKSIIGPCEAIGNGPAAATYANGPTLVHWQHVVKNNNGPKQSHWQKQVHISMGPSGCIGGAPHEKQWAQTKPSAAAGAYFIGPIWAHWWCTT